MKKKISVFLSFLLLLTSSLCHTPEAKNMAAKKKRHEACSWTVHQIAKDFKLLDVWEFPILADQSKNQNFHFFLTVLQKNRKLHLKNMLSLRFLVAGALVVLRNIIGRIFLIDREKNTLPIPGCKETSLKERLSKEDQEKNLAGQEVTGDKKESGFRMVYLYENECLWELSNNTVHALMHVGWVHKYGEYYTAQLAVYAKTRGWFGSGYMKLIMPFRRHIIYPVMLDIVRSRWQEQCR